MRTQSGIESATALDGTGLTFRNDGTFDGNLGCNTVNGAYAADGDGLTFDNALITARACAFDAPYENAIRDALGQARGTTRTRDGIALLDARGRTLIELTR